MPHFYFNIRDGNTLVPDEEGSTLPDIEAARFEARESARDIIVEALKARREISAQVIEITDAQGRVVDTFNVRDLLS